MTLNLILIIFGIPFFLVVIYLTRRFWTAAAYRSKLEYIKTIAGISHKVKTETKGE
jgi:hypothetical protein